MPKPSYRIFTDTQFAYFVTCTVVNWFPILTHDTYVRIILDSLAYLQSHKHTQLNAFVVMPSHLHAVLWPEQGINLSDVLRDFKRFTSRAISGEAFTQGDTRALGVFSIARQRGRGGNTSQYQVWQEGSHPEAIYSRDFAQQKLDYIHSNPVRAKLVENALDWPYSSARAYFQSLETYPPVELLKVN